MKCILFITVHLTQNCTTERRNFPNYGLHYMTERFEDGKGVIYHCVEGFNYPARFQFYCTWSKFRIRKRTVTQPSRAFWITWCMIVFLLMPKKQSDRSEIAHLMLNNNQYFSLIQTLRTKIKPYAKYVSMAWATRLVIQATHLRRKHLEFWNFTELF